MIPAFLDHLPERHVRVVAMLRHVDRRHLERIGLQPERSCFQISSSASCLNSRTRIGEFRSMSFSTMAWISFGGTGWLALALLASEIWSLSQLASNTPAARAAEVMSARTSVR